MKEKIDIGAIGTFGLPNGCTQSAFYSGKFSKNKSLDLNTNAIKIYPNTVLYVVRREKIQNEISLVFGKYTFAKERNSNRTGTFIGSFLSFYNCYTNSNQIYGLLTELHDLLITNENNISDNVLQVEHSRALQVKLPQDFEKLNQNLSDINDRNQIEQSIGASHNFVVYDETLSVDRIVKFFQYAFNFYPNTETIYFTQSQEIATFVNDKNLLNIKSFKDFENEIEAIKISRIEQEKEREALRIAALNKQEALRLENEKRLEEQKKLEEQKRKEIENKARILTRKNNHNYHQIKPEAAKNLINDYNQLLDMYNIVVSKNEDINQRFHAANNFHEPNRPQKRERKTENYTQKVLFYFIIPAICMILIAWNLYFFFIAEQESVAIETVQTIEEVPIIQNDNPDLRPLPNAVLSVQEKDAIVNDSIRGKKIDDLVNIIFEKNPSEIATVYSFQKQAYKAYLYKQNETSFKIAGDTICINATIPQIPSFKSPKEN